MNPLTYLERRDKWYLGGGDVFLWAPPFPLFLDKPGFWDKGSFYDYSVEPLFTITVLNENLRPIEFLFRTRSWNPSKLIQIYGSNEDLTLREEKTMLPQDVLITRMILTNYKEIKRRLHLIIWTAQEHNEEKGLYLTEAAFDDGIAFFNRKMVIKDRNPFSFQVALGVDQSINSYSINRSQVTPNYPRWRYTPFYEKITNEGLPNEEKLDGLTRDGLVYLGLHIKVAIQAKAKRVITAGAGINERSGSAVANTREALFSQVNPLSQSEKNWRQYFNDLPRLSISDPYIQKYYWYRWYGLRLLGIKGGINPNYPHSAICEGIDYFRVPITYSAQCHMRETRWLEEPDFAQGSLLDFGEHQNSDGSLRGHIYPEKMDHEGFFYHADWGTAVLEVAKVHPCREFLAKAYKILSNYINFLDQNRDREGSGLYDIVNQFETGQEYSPRYLAVAEDADQSRMGSFFRLKGVDVTVYAYQLKKALCEIAINLGRGNAANRWREEAEFIKSSVLEKMWDQEEEMFFDVNPKDMSKTGVSVATNFYPYYTDIVSKEHLEGLKKHLLNPEEFWTQYPVPTTSLKEELANPEAEWKGKRHHCPWNGRVWPMTNSHIAEALAFSAQRFNDDHLKKKAVDFINKFIRMMFYNGEIDYPNCFEHYNPLTGKESRYRGIDDYQHSWVVDLILKYIIGLQPKLKGILEINPLPTAVKYYELRNLKLQGYKVSVKFDAQKSPEFSLRLNNDKFEFNKSDLPIKLNLNPKGQK